MNDQLKRGRFLRLVGGGAWAGPSGRWKIRSSSGFWWFIVKNGIANSGSHGSDDCQRWFIIHKLWNQWNLMVCCGGWRRLGGTEAAQFFEAWSRNSGVLSNRAALKPWKPSFGTLLEGIDSYRWQSLAIILEFSFFLGLAIGEPLSVMILGSFTVLKLGKSRRISLAAHLRQDVCTNHISIKTQRRHTFGAFGWVCGMYLHAIGAFSPLKGIKHVIFLGWPPGCHHGEWTNR